MAGNIMGGPFFPWVTKQIEARQRSLGEGSSSNPTNLLYQQSKTPWLRLASSVDFYNDEGGGIDILKRLGGLDGINESEITGPGAAKNFILQGGSIALTADSYKANAGLNLTDRTFNGAYGWGGVSNRGLVPMPGITGASVKFLNNGALTKTEITIKCYSRNQLALVDALYMRPGYSLLLEFGWSTYLDTEAQAVSPPLSTYDNFYSPALSYLFDPNIQGANQHILVQKILKERKVRSGNYEGVYGKITNFKWSLNPDGSYDCIVYLTGLGEIIESLKMNINAGSADGFSPSEEDEEDDDTPPIIANAYKTTLNSILYNIYQKASNDLRPPKPPIVNKTFLQKLNVFDDLGRFVNDTIDAIVKPILTAGSGNQKDHIKDAVIEDFPMINSSTGEMETRGIVIPSAMLALGGINMDVNKNESPQIFITFGYLMALIQKNIVPHTEQRKVPYFYFDMNFNNLDLDRNFIKKIPGQVSLNPKICLIPYYNNNITQEMFGAEFVKQGFDIEFNQLEDKRSNLNKTLRKGADWDAGEVYLGRLACLYININHIAAVLEAIGKAEDGSKSMLEFLNTLIGDCTRSLGGLNDIIIKNNQDGTRVGFFENIPQRFNTPPPEITLADPCRFNTFGFTDGVGGSIVRNIGIDGSISSNFSAMITIGAQSNGNQVGGNATSFSNYNSGLIDRVIPTKTHTGPDDFEKADYDEDGVISDEEAERYSEEQENTKANLLKQAENVNTTLNKITKSGWFYKTLGFLGFGGVTGGVFADVYRDRDWMDDDIEMIQEVGTQYLSLLDGLHTQPQGSGGTGQLNAPFFLPFNLSLDLDGIGGIGLMQKFNIDEKILPPTYDKDSVEIIVRGVNHKVDSSSWTTSLETQSTPTSKNPPVEKGSIFSKISAIFNPQVFQEAPPESDLPELLRMRVTRIMDDGEQTLGIMDIIAEDEQTVLFSLATSELPWLGNQNNISCIPADTYKVKSHVSGKYGRCFWLVGNAANGYKFNELYGNGYTRGAVLIHMAPKAPKWLHGCIGPGLKFNMQNNQKGRQKGTGQFYLEPSKAQSQQAINKILDKLYSAGSFELQIINQGGAINFDNPTPQWSELPRTFDTSVQNLAGAKNLLPNPYKGK
tara:strand:+ start:746 stop:4093 length:3348 start_codon:yes stop_codon:yes gene_type:complete